MFFQLALVALAVKQLVRDGTFAGRDSRLPFGLLTVAAAVGGTLVGWFTEWTTELEPMTTINAEAMALTTIGREPILLLLLAAATVTTIGSWWMRGRYALISVVMTLVLGLGSLSATSLYSDQTFGIRVGWWTVIAAVLLAAVYLFDVFTLRRHVASGRSRLALSATGVVAGLAGATVLLLLGALRLSLGQWMIFAVGVASYGNTHVATFLPVFPDPNAGRNEAESHEPSGSEPSDAKPPLDLVDGDRSPTRTRATV